MSSDSHADLGPELRALAQTILDRIDPAVRAAAAAAALLTVVRAMVADIESASAPEQPPPDEPPPPGRSRYQHIPVTVEE